VRDAHRPPAGAPPAGLARLLPPAALAAADPAWLGWLRRLVLYGERAGGEVPGRPAAAGAGDGHGGERCRPPVPRQTPA
jgi:hypothetical protein